MSLFNLSGAIALLATGTGSNPKGVTVTPGPTYTVDGNGRQVKTPGVPWVAPSASVQPLSGRNAQTLPEGERADEYREVWLVPDSPARLVSVVSTDAQRGSDTLSLDGEVYEVTNSRDWRAAGAYLHVVVRKQRR